MLGIRVGTNRFNRVKGRPMLSEWESPRCTRSRSRRQRQLSMRRPPPQPIPAWLEFEGFPALDVVVLLFTIDVLISTILWIAPITGFGSRFVPDDADAASGLHHFYASYHFYNVYLCVFGFLPKPRNASISPPALSLLRSSLIELVLQQINLTLTPSIFGETLCFEVLKFPGGITVIPLQTSSIWERTKALFNFIISNSINHIQDNMKKLKDQQKVGG
ncbi:hypothetical protein KFK09_025038 [Dendrobium nobile]|uniref:DUF7036 domain-containing protein n=1 Tax=Dendrobium nobile TaxID=94219 RepID=A0A8T3AGK1_DENNO|nr:hypothetical protein KFK09_025038 [Dendrobium nobile]